jgi:hypothetical protein
MPSPVLWTSRPPNSSPSRPVSSSCTFSSSRPRRSPSSPARWVEPTMSVNSTVASGRVGWATRRTPVMNRSTWSRRAPASPRTATARSLVARSVSLLGSALRGSARARPGRAGNPAGAAQGSAPGSAAGSSMRPSRRRPAGTPGSPGAGGGALEPRQSAAEPLVAGAARGLHRDHGLSPPELVELGQDRLGDLGALASMSARVRSGWVPAKKIAIGLASTWASKAARSEPTSSRTATRSWAYVSHGGSESRWQGIGGAGAAAVEHAQPGETRPGCARTGRSRGPPRPCRRGRSFQWSSPGRVGPPPAPGRRSGRAPAARNSSPAAPLSPSRKEPLEHEASRIFSRGRHEVQTARQSPSAGLACVSDRVGLGRLAAR